MKKLWMVLFACILLTGCGAAEVFETLGAVEHERNELPAMANVQISLPEEAVTETLADGDSKLYDCGTYTVAVQTARSGDLQGTVQWLCGFSMEQLTVMESRSDGYKRFEWVWSAAGENGDILCRAAVLDDGNYHYCLYTMAEADQVSQVQGEWNEIFGSFRLC